jgi:hypothetical protein
MSKKKSPYLGWGKSIETPKNLSFDSLDQLFNYLIGTKKIQSDRATKPYILTDYNMEFNEFLRLVKGYELPDENADAEALHRKSEEYKNHLNLNTWKEFERKKLSSKISNYAKAYFCQVIEKIEPTGLNSAIAICETICRKYGLEYKVKVSQNYSASPTKKTLQEMQEKILPQIDEKTRQEISDYLKANPKK